MKIFLPLLLVMTAVSGGAQSMPYNPDANDDGYITSPDLLSFLPLFGSQVGVDSSLTCDYDGTPFESFVVGVITEEIVLDSVYVEYLIRDTLTYFTPGCPDLVVEPLVLERAFFITDAFFNSTSIGYQAKVKTTLFGYERECSVTYRETDNTYVLTLIDFEVGQLPNYGWDGYWDDLSTSDITAHLPLPFPDFWFIDEDGFQIDWRATSWIGACEYFRLLPYWHYAE